MPHTCGFLVKLARDITKNGIGKLMWSASKAIWRWHNTFILREYSIQVISLVYRDTSDESMGLRQIRKIVHAPGMPGTFSPPPWVSDPDMHHDTCITHVPWCMSGKLTSGFLWSWWLGKRSWHSRRMRKPQFYFFWQEAHSGKALSCER